MAEFIDSQPQFQIEEQTPVWKYMSFSKFVSLIANSEIYMSRADKFEDLFEGAISKETFDHYMQQLEVHFALADKYSLIKKERNLNEEREKIKKWLKEGPSMTFISCWYLGECENDAMWKIYGETREAVAIKSTINKLRIVFPDEVTLLPVQYLPLEIVQLPGDHRIWQFGFKRPEFAFESELRCVKFDAMQSQQDGYKVEVKNLNYLVDKVIISPRAPSWLHQTVTRLIKNFKLEVEVTQSNISGNPWDF